MVISVCVSVCVKENSDTPPPLPVALLSRYQEAKANAGFMRIKHRMRSVRLSRYQHAKANAGFMRIKHRMRSVRLSRYREAKEKRRKTTLEVF